jgi:glutamate/tyrosine decarboxylase-like PLP-dependent enzyme
MTNDLKRALDAALRHSLEHLETLNDTPVGATRSLESLRQSLFRPLSDEGLDAAQVVEELAADAKGGLHGTAGGRFYAWVIGGALPAAVAADWLTSAWDQNAGMFTVAPAAAIVEEAAGTWIKDLLHLPASASFALVTGGQMASTTGLAAARHRVLQNAGWDVERRGLFGAPPIRVVTGAHRHATILRALRLLGMGTECLIELPLDAEGRLQPNALKEELSKNPGAPTIVLMQAGDVNIGAFDDFDTLMPIARQSRAWVHIDGAFGLWAAASPAYRHFLKGADQADSWATDGHKWLNVPYDCGYAIIADADAHRAAMSQHAEYLLPSEARDQVDWTPEFSRRARGFATYAAIRQLGRKGVASLVERCCESAHAIATGIGALSGAELIWEPRINQGLVRFLDSKPGATEKDHDKQTEEVIRRIVASGEAFFGATTWNGHRCMRISVCNWQTSSEDVRRTIAAVRRELTRYQHPQTQTT